MNTGAFINFLLPFKKNGVGISAENQAKAILQESQKLIREGAKGVGICYSANYGQTCKIEETYKKGDWYTQTDGANQAAVMHSMEAQMSNIQYKDLQGKLRIVPITTMNDYGSDHQVKPWNDQVHMDIVKYDLERIKTYVENGWIILGWQNQITASDPKHPYAIGGGVATVPADISDEIQNTLIHYAIVYKKQ